jgi:subtilisin-like proprotein convertase family protein
MKKIILFVFTIVFFSVAKIYSQTLPYTFTQSSGTYTAITGGTSPGANFTGTGIGTNAVSAAITLPFTFTYNGTGYTQVIISNNGFITFGATAPTTTTYNPISATTAYGGAVAGYGFNLVNSPVAGATPDITYTTLGSSPSRTFVVEFKDVGRTGITGDRMNFQIRLSETTNAINVVYGTWAATSLTTTVGNFGQVGLRGSANTFYNTRQVNTSTPHATWATSGSAADNGATSRQTQGALGGADGPNSMRYNSTFLPVSGQIYTWTPISSSFYQTLPYTQNFESWTDLFAKNDKAGNGILSHPSSGNSSWRNYNEAVVNSYWSGTSGRPTLGVGQATGAASFYNYGAASGRTGYLDFYLNLSATGSKTLTFDLINPDPGTLTVQFSTDGGVTFSNLSGYTTTALSSWATQTVSIGSTTSSTCVLRFLATSTYGSYNIAIDNINIFVPVTPTITSYTPNTNLCTGGGQTVTITGTNFTGATQVQFNGVNAASYSVVSATSITAVTPSGLTAGNITVTTGGGTATSSAYTTFTNPTVTVSGSATKYCGNTPVTLTASGATTYTWSAITDLYTNAAGTTAYTALTNANPVYSKANANITYTVVGTTSGCTASSTIAVNKGTFVTISSVTPQTLSACTGGTDSITVVASVAAPVSSYVFASSTGASLDPMTGATVYFGSGIDNAAGSYTLTTFPSGFVFPYEGVNQTQFTASDNGVLRLGSTAVNTTQYGSITGQSLLLSVAGADMGSGSDGGVSYLLTGTAPNRVFILQYRLRHTWSTTLAINNTFQVWLYETSGKIEYRYGTMGSSGTPAHGIGLSGATTTNYQSVAVSTGLSSTSTITSNTTLPASGTMYTFTPPTLTYAWTSLNPSNTLINTTLPTTVATITDTGKFQIVVTEAGGCSALDSTVKIFLGGGNPNITAMNTTNNSYCYTDSTTLSTTVLGGCPPYAYSWSGGLGSTASVKAKPTTTTKYYVTVTDNNTNVDIDSITVTIISPQILTVLGDTICGTDTARLSATANAGDSIVWYRSATGTNIVKFGANLDTVLSANDTFYVGATVITGTNTYNVGPPARVAALNYFISNNWGITFNASEPCVINSVAIYPSTAGIISIRAQSSMTTPTIFGTYSMNITAGQIGTKVIVPVNFVIPTAGTGYKMIVEAATTVTGLHRETPPAPGFAYSTVGSPISLPSSEWGGTTTGTYYFFYDWSVTKTTYCQSSRTPVVVVRNTPPTISATAPTFVCIGESVALNVTSPNDPNYTYTWNPGSLSGASQTVTPGSTTTYTVNAYDAITGCRASKDTIVQVRPYPTKPILNVDSVYLCNGTVQPLNITNGFNSGTASATSGTISLAIPDNSATGISSILNLSTVPTGATIDSVAVTFNLNHAYLADAEVTLTAPNGKVIALAADQGPSGTGSYVNTRISSNNANPVLSTTSTPISGTYRANATVAGSLKGSFGANLTSTFSDLFTTANGNWTLTAFDDDATDLGTLTSYSIDIYYRNTTSYSWTPISSLYTNVTTTTGYTSGDSITVYAKPTASTDYIVTASLNGCSTSDTAIYEIKSAGSSVALFNGSTNGSPLTLDCEDAGWTYYADPSDNNKWLFGIDWDTNLVAKSTAQIALDYNTSGVIKDVKQRPGSSADYDGAYIMRRYWNVNNATLNAGSTPVKIRFFYDPADTTAARDSMDVNRVAYATASPGGNPYYATPWKWFKTVGVAFTPALINDGNNFSFSNIELTPSAMSTLNGVSYVQFDNITSFSGGSGGIGFTPHSGGVGLPVTLVSFAGNVEEAHNHIQWTTASELNNDHFELESSVDGKNFTTLATISGHGTTTETHQYSFNDYKYNMPSTYYRLKQVDFDGKSTTTNMIILTRMSNASTSAVVSVYPNPTNDITTLSIDVQENAEATYTIHDITGKIVSEGAINCIAGMNNTTIQTGDLADGMYIVDVLINGKHINTRLVKSTK